MPESCWRIRRGGRAGNANDFAVGIRDWVSSRVSVERGFSPADNGRQIALIGAWISGNRWAGAAKIWRAKSSKSAATSSLRGVFAPVAASWTSSRETTVCSSSSRSEHGQVRILGHRSSRSLGRNSNVSAEWPSRTCASTGCPASRADSMSCRSWSERGSERLNWSEVPSVWNPCGVSS